MEQRNVDPNADLTEAQRRDRWFQAVMEWWKTWYDFYKHLMTIALLSIGTLGALVGGPFKSVVQLDDPKAAWGAKILVMLIVFAFAIAAAVAAQGMHAARENIFAMKDVRTNKEFLEMREAPVGGRLKVHRNTVWKIVQWSYLAGLFLFIIFLFIPLFGD